MLRSLIEIELTLGIFTDYFKRNLKKRSTALLSGSAVMLELFILNGNKKKVYCEVHVFFSYWLNLIAQLEVFLNPVMTNKQEQICFDGSA